jgi:Flp pilus assembly protein TadB
MANVYVPPSGARWPPTGEPIGGYGSYAQARRVARALMEDGIPAQDLTVLSVTGWRAAGDWVAVLSGLYALLAGAVVPVLIVASNQSPTIWASVAAGLVVLASLLAVAIGTYFRRRTRRFLNSFDPPVDGRHVLLCAPGTVPRARDLLAGLPPRQSTQD